MSKAKTTDFNDLDLDEIMGGIKSEENVIYMDAELPGEKTEAEVWADCLKRMDKHTEKMWITVKYGNCLYTYDAYTCSDEIFFDWIGQVWPPSKKLEHKASQYNTPDIRLRTLINIAGLHKTMQFPSTSLAR